MSKKTTQAIHFIDDDGNLHINGAAIRRHPEKPWLFSANDVRASIKDRILKIGAKRMQKADEREEAGEVRGRAPKTPEDFFVEKAPSSYIKVSKKSTELISCYAKAIKKQAKDDIIGLCGSRRIRIRLLQLHGFEKASEMRAFILGLTNEDLCYKVQNGNTENRGVWLCHQMLVDYAAFLSPKFHAQVTQAFIEIASLNTKALEKRLNAVRIAKGTPAREAHVDEHQSFTIACASKYVNAIFPLNGIHEVILGDSIEKVAEARGIKPPYNDYLTVNELNKKVLAMGLTRIKLFQDARSKIPNKEAKVMGMLCAAEAEVLSDNKDLQKLLSVQARLLLSPEKRAQIELAESKLKPSA